MCLKYCFNLFHLEKARVEQDDWLNCYVAKGMSCLISRWLCKHETNRL